MSLNRFIVLIALGLLAFAGFTRWQEVDERPLIMTDGQGYYAYLPATFIYQDLQFLFVSETNEAYYQENKRAAFIVDSESGNVNKYFAGTAVLQAPFFVAASGASAIMGLPVDGYSKPFQLSVGLAAIFYLVLGLWFLGRLLFELGYQCTPVLATLVTILFATNLFYYSIYEPSMSHVYSFFTISAFLFYGRKALTAGNKKTAFLAAALLGITVLIRPVNGLVLLGLPAVTGGLFGFVTGLESIFKLKKTVVLSILIGVLIMALQPFIYWLQTGMPFVWSYQEEGFNFLSPEFANVLFSYRKGLFVYCPVLILAVIGIIKGASVRKPGKLEAGVFLLLVTWVIASWWMWFYGGCYGHRAFIEFYPFFALGLAYAFSYGFGFLGKNLLLATIPLFIGLQMIQTYQYVRNIIPFDNMNKEKYWNLFLRTGKDLSWYYSGYPGQDSYRGLDSTVAKHDFESELGWGNEDQRTEEVAYQGRFSAFMGVDKQYGITFRTTPQTVDVFPDVIRVSGWVKSASRTTDLSIVCALEDSTGASYFWRKRPLRPHFEGRNEWSYFTSLFRCGKPKNSQDKIVVFPMRTDDSAIYFDDVEISLVKTN